MTPARAQEATRQLVVFVVDQRRLGIELARVDRVVRMVALEPLPTAPTVIAGVFDLAGEVLPAADVRHRLRQMPRAPRASDQLLIVRTARRRLALVVDAVDRLVSVPDDAVTPATRIVPGLEHVRGVAQLPDLGIVLIHDVDAFLSLDEESQLESAFAARRP